MIIYFLIPLFCMVLGTLAFNVWWAITAVTSPSAGVEMKRRKISHFELWTVVILISVLFPLSWYATYKVFSAYKGGRNV